MKTETLKQLREILCTDSEIEKDLKEQEKLKEHHIRKEGLLLEQKELREQYTKAKDTISQLEFETKEYKKSYLAIVKGKIDKEQTIVKVACGAKHMAAITFEGTMWSWGHGEFGKLGLGHTLNMYEPTLITKLEIVVQFVPKIAISLGAKLSLSLLFKFVCFLWFSIFVLQFFLLI